MSSYIHLAFILQKTKKIYLVKILDKVKLNLYNNGRRGDIMSNSSNDRERKIKILQQNLSSIRKIAGWTAEQLGDKIGVTKQTISNLENSKTPMNFTQYIAIRAVLDCEVEEHPENEALAQAIDILLNHADKLDDENYKNVKNSIDTVAAAAAGGVAGAALTGAFTGMVLPVAKVAGLTLLGPVGGAIGIGTAVGVVGATWLKKLIKKK